MSNISLAFYRNTNNFTKCELRYCMVYQRSFYFYACDDDVFDLFVDRGNNCTFRCLSPTRRKTTENPVLLATDMLSATKERNYSRVK